MTPLFLQSEVKNPYLFYQEMIEENPVFWDETNKIWAVYSYEHCIEILNNTNAYVPTFPQNNNLNKHASEIINNLARLSIGIHHEIAKETAVILFSHMKSVGIDAAIKELLKNESNLNRINWVDLVCKKLPVLTVLKSFDFNDNDSLLISNKISSLVKIMHSFKTIEDVELINCVSEEIYLITKKHIAELPFYEIVLNKIASSYGISSEETISICVCNLIGLFIQSFDATRGLLSNSLLQILSNKKFDKNENDKIWLQKMIVETLRFDPPIHNTRRVAIADIQLNGMTIRTNDPILIVLAAANRDSKQFEKPMNFDIDRHNNQEHLTFGTGGHMCLAKHFSVNLATDTLYYLLSNYTVSILENEIKYEPMINARLPKAIWISLL